MQNEITKQRLEKEFKVTGAALKKAKIIIPERSHLYNAAIDFLDMAKRYYDDALHFKEKGDFASAFGALNYAHGWLDAGARLGFFDVDHDSTLFTVD